jgi:hypothetical protein
MSTRGLGPLQSRLLTALQEHATFVTLERLVYFAAGIAELDDRLYWRKGPKPTASVYSSTARAVASLRGRGLLEGCLVGSRRTAPGGRFRNPSTCLWVRVSQVETSEQT